MKEFFEGKKEFFEGLEGLATALTKFSKELNQELEKEIEKLPKEDRENLKNNKIQVNK